MKWTSVTVAVHIGFRCASLAERLVQPSQPSGTDRSSASSWSPVLPAPAKLSLTRRTPVAGWWRSRPPPPLADTSIRKVVPPSRDLTGALRMILRRYRWVPPRAGPGGCGGAKRKSHRNRHGKQKQIAPHGVQPPQSRLSNGLADRRPAPPRPLRKLNRTHLPCRRPGGTNNAGRTTSYLCGYPRTR